MTRLRVKAEKSSMFCGFVREERAYLADRIRFSIKGSWSRHSAQGPQGGTEEEPEESTDWLTHLCLLYNPGAALITVDQALSHPSPIKKTPST